ncbi:hypothetical protein EV649_4733 [Kribbella sp. VKM Ac-2569]|nr:hypothetical protein EV649_4733 [Kribbella sp. VKM Ac-2569]
MHADQADIDIPLVRELVAVQFPQWAALPLEPVDSSGVVNAIYRLGTDLSVRLPLRPSSADIVQREQAKLAAFLPVAIPSVEAIGSPTDAFPGEWSVHRWLAGTHPSPDALADPRRLATDLAAFVDEFRTALDVDDATWLRGRGRVLSQILIVWSYQKDTNPAVANSARHVIGEVLAAPR